MSNIVRRRKKFNKKKRGYVKNKGLRSNSFLSYVMPSTYMCKLRYCDEITIDPLEDSFAGYTYRANDLYDPDVSIGGHQPHGFDQIMAFYQHFTVLGSKIKVLLQHIGASDVGQYGVILSDTGQRVAAATSITDLLESEKRSKVFQYGMNNFQDTRFRGIVLKFSAKKFFKNKNVKTDEQFQGNTTGSPTELAYYEIFAASCAGTDPGALHLLVQIDYIALFSGFKDPGQS